MTGAADIGAVVVTTGGSTLTVGSLVRTSGWVDGRLGKAVSGDGAVTLEVGSGGLYAPIA